MNNAVMQVRLSLLATMAMCISSSVAGPIDQDAPSDLGPGDTITKSGKVLPYQAMPLDDLGPIQVTFDTTGLRNVSPVPAPGVHPRMLKSPEDRPEMVRLYQTTSHGKRMYAMLVGWCDILKGKIASLEQCPKNEQDEPLAAYQRSHFGELAAQYQRILAEIVNVD